MYLFCVFVLPVFKMGATVRHRVRLELRSLAGHALGTWILMAVVFVVMR